MRCPHELMVLLAGLALSGCDAEADIQLVRGRVEARLPGSSTTTSLGATARTEGRLVAASPVDARGVFLLALPTGGPYRIELASPTLGPITIGRSRERLPLYIEVCDAGALVNTGTITLELGCIDSLECTTARDELARCRARSQVDCGAEEVAVQSTCDDGPGGPGPCPHPEPSAHTRTAPPTSIGCGGLGQ